MNVLVRVPGTPMADLPPVDAFEMVRMIATARTLGQTMGAALVALIFGLFDFSGGGAADASRAALWLGAAFAGIALVVGGGQAGLTVAATLVQLGVDTLVIDRLPRVGDCWRTRYHSLALHNNTEFNHLPYMPYPPNWPTYLPKDKLDYYHNERKMKDADIAKEVQDTVLQQIRYVRLPSASVQIAISMRIAAAASLIVAGPAHGAVMAALQNTHIVRVAHGRLT